MMLTTSAVQPENGWQRWPLPYCCSACTSPLYCSQRYPVRSYSLQIVWMTLVRSWSYTIWKSLLNGLPVLTCA